MADVFLLVLSLIHELRGRAAALRRQAVLQRLVVRLPVCVRVVASQSTAEKLTDSLLLETGRHFPSSKLSAGSSRPVALPLLEFCCCRKRVSSSHC